MIIPTGGAAAPVRLRLFYIDAYGADPTGQRLSDAAFTAAYAAATASLAGGNPNAGAMVVFGAGLYQFSLGVIAVTDRRIGLTGQGSQATTLYSNGSGGDLVFVTDTSGVLPGAAPVGGFTLYGWNTGAASNGLHIGDRISSVIADIAVYGFNGGPTSRGVWFRNDNGRLFERNFVQVLSNQNSILYDFDGNNGAANSFDYGTWFLAFNQAAITAAAVGLRVINGAHLYGGGGLNVFGNASNANAARTVTCLQVGASAADTARVNCPVNINLECDASAGTVTDLVVQGASAAAGIIQCHGRMIFLNAAGAFTAGSVTLPAVVTGWGTWAGPLFSAHGVLTALGTAAAGLSTYSG